LKVRVSVLTPDGEVDVSTDDSSTDELEAVVVGSGVADTVLVGARAEFAPLLFVPEHPTATNTRLIRAEYKNTLLRTSSLLTLNFAPK